MQSTDLWGGRGGSAAGVVSTPADRSGERYALGVALRHRESDILRHLQAAYLESSGATYEEVVATSLWDILSIAVDAIVDWLLEGGGASEYDKTRIASLGGSAAGRQVAAGTAEGPRDGVRASVPAVVENRAVDMLSVTLLTKLNLWWCEYTQQVLTEEAARLGTSDATLEEARAMVMRSCHASLVRMAKQFDAELAVLHRELTQLALHDPLTGLANRKVFLDRLQRALARLTRHAGGLAVIFIDIDDFKSVNDVHGHGVGDAVLIEIAARMIEWGRPEDLFARLSGDEFVVLVEDLPRPMTDVGALAERIRAGLLAPIATDGRALEVTTSMGVAVVTAGGVTPTQVMAVADAALYSVKRSGRNGIAVLEMGGRGDHPATGR